MPPIAAIAAVPDFIFVVLADEAAHAAPRAELWPRLEEAHEPKGSMRVDHSAWDAILQPYVDSGHPSGVHRVRYREVTPGDG